MREAVIYARIGAVLYVVWGLLHLGSGLLGIWLTGQPGTPDRAGGMAAMPTQASGLSEAGLGLIRQHSHDIATGGAVAMAIALLDLGMIVFVLLPGHVPLLDGLIGPVLWLGGLALTTLARPARPHSTTIRPKGLPA